MVMQRGKEMLGPVMPEAMKRVDRLRSVSLLLCISFFCFLFIPFLNKAYHIDDAVWMDFARMVAWNPLKTAPAPYPFMGGMLTDFVPYDGSHPPLVLYYMKLIMALFGDREIVMHSAFLIFPALAVVSLAGLTALLFPDAKRSAMLVPLFAMAIPAFLVNAHNVMTDVPTLAMLLAALFWYCSAIEGDQTSHAYAGGLFLAASVFSSYQMVVFIPLIFLYAWKRKRLNRPFVFSLFFPVLVLVIWGFLIYNAFGIIPLLKSNIAASTQDLASELGRGYSLSVLWERVVSILANLGTSLFFVYFVYAVVARKVIRVAGMLLLGTVLCYLVLSRSSYYSFFHLLLLSSLIAAGLLLLVEAVVLTLRPQDTGSRAFLLIWAFTVIGYNIFILPWGSARYMLPAVPPLVILFLGGLDWDFRRKTRGIAVSLLLFLSAAFGFSSSYADFVHADTYRKFAQEVNHYRSVRSGSLTVWYIGEWGMRYYMDRIGARYLQRDSREPEIGDVLALPEMPIFWDPHISLIPRLKLRVVKEYPGSFSLKLFHRGSRAGFYSHHWGLLPFTYSAEPQETFQIWEVMR